MTDITDPNRQKAVDAWIEAIHEDPYALCPCGCGKKFRFAVKEGIDSHEAHFIEQYLARLKK